MLNYADCQKLFLKARNKEKGKKIDHNTYLRKEENDFLVKLHNTDIIRISQKNVYTVNTGGWQTPTTKDRLNNYLPIRLFQEKHIWYYVGPNPDTIYFDWKDKKPFFEGLQCNLNGKVLNPPNQSKTEKEKAKRKKLDKMIKTYIQGFIEDIKKNGLGEPSNGDCFGCLMVSADKGIIRGEMHKNEVMGFDHYISHFKEKYFVRSLLWKAIQERGYMNPAVIWQIGCIDHHFKRTLQWFFNRRKAELIKYI